MSVVDYQNAYFEELIQKDKNYIFESNIQIKPLNNTSIFNTHDLQQYPTIVSKSIGKLEWTFDFKEYQSSPSFIQYMWNESKKNGVQAEWFGVISDPLVDSKKQLQEALNYASNIGTKEDEIITVHINGNIGITPSIFVPNNVKLKGGTITCLSRSIISNPIFFISPNSDKIEIEDININMNNLPSSIFSIGEDSKNIKMNNLSFKNCLDLEKDTEQAIINIQTGVEGKLNNLKFFNIKKLGNGIIADAAGRGACIKTTSYNAMNNNPYKLSISNIKLENCYNIDLNGNIVEEDFDALYFYHINSVGGIVVKDIVAKNVGKRIVKIQSSGVIIDGINSYNDIQHNLGWIVGVFRENNVVKNINSSGNITSAIGMVDCDNVIIDSIVVKSDLKNINDNVRGGIDIINSKNIVFRNITGTLPNGINMYGKFSENIVFEDFDINFYKFILRINSRTLSSIYEPNSIIQNVEFKNIKANQIEGSSNQSAIQIENKNESSAIQNIHMSNISINFNQLYPYSLFKISNVRDLYGNNIKLNNNKRTNQVIAVTNNSKNILFENLVISNIGEDLIVEKNSEVSILSSTLGDVILKNKNSKLIIEKTNINTILFNDDGKNTNFILKK